MDLSQGSQCQKCKIRHDLKEVVQPKILSSFTSYLSKWLAFFCETQRKPFGGTFLSIQWLNIMLDPIDLLYRQKSLKMYFCVCSAEERNDVLQGWVNYAKIFSFGWIISSRPKTYWANNLSRFYSHQITYSWLRSVVCTPNLILF